jgi:hypothetical protein
VIPPEEMARRAEFYARHHRRRAAARGVGVEALFLACLAGAAEAGAGFDPGGGRSFPAWASRFIRRRIAAALEGP